MILRLYFKGIIILWRHSKNVLQIYVAIYYLWCSIFNVSVILRVLCIIWWKNDLFDCTFSHWWLNLIVGQIRLVFCQLSVNTYVSVDRLALWGDSNEYQQHISLCSSNQVRWCYSISSLHAFAIYTHQTPLYYKLNVRFTGAWTLFSYFCSCCW